MQCTHNYLCLRLCKDVYNALEIYLNMYEISGFMKIDIRFIYALSDY